MYKGVVLVIDQERLMASFVPEMEAHATKHLMQLTQFVHGSSLRAASLIVMSKASDTRAKAASLNRRQLQNDYNTLNASLRIFARTLPTIKRCLKIQHLQGFKEDFDVSQLDPSKDENLEPYEEEAKFIDVPVDNEFYSLPPPKAMHLSSWLLASIQCATTNLLLLQLRQGSPLPNQLI
ncbi:hypothetical protein Salat_0846600 [Sesamum alatum]|uniref:Uncharacterized protein n=1 Tax=Sesamum alatum TaxID=300844 RepID=A0AAE2CQK0_9LAMI|nr:hypothetical protein Salat_0846600 [Sesamum alatum]